MGRFKGYFDLAPEAVCVLDEGGLITHVNKRFCNEIAPLERVKGLSFTQCLIKPDEVPRFENAISLARQQQRVQVDAEPEDTAPVSDAGVVAPVLRDAVTLVLGSVTTNLPIYRR
jgi:PAS domain-containing protein